MITIGHKKVQSFSDTAKPCYHAPPDNLPPAIVNEKEKEACWIILK